MVRYLHIPVFVVGNEEIHVSHLEERVVVAETRKGDDLAAFFQCRIRPVQDILRSAWLPA